MCMGIHVPTKSRQLMSGLSKSVVKVPKLRSLGPPVVPFLTLFWLGDSVPLLNRLRKKSWYPYF